MSFVHLHCHTTWSLLDGAVTAEALPALAAERGFEAVAMTDHDSLLGAVRFTKACRAAGIKPIYGAELTVRSAIPSGGAGATTSHVTVIARNKTGYGNLCRLITGAHLTNERGDPETTFESIAERCDGLFVFSGCARGDVARLAAQGRIPQAVEVARKWHGALGEAYRVEVFDHRGYGDRTLRDRLLKVAHEAEVHPVATNDVHYASSGDSGTHELLHALREIVPLSRTQALRSNSEYHLKPPAEMRALFDDVPEAVRETLYIAEGCDFELDLGGHHFPEVPGRDGRSAAGDLARRCFEGAARRYGQVPGAVEDRLQHELGVIFHMGWPAFFLLVADIVDHIRYEMGIRCSCRGSAAGSLVCYVLGISDVDPVRYDLLFERFMNARREELPDIDVDVESHRREEVLDHILKTYGRDQTAVCCMVDTFRARGAIREVGKALGIPLEEIDFVANAFPHIRAKDIPAAIERLPELGGSNLKAGQLEQLFELCFSIDGFPRHLALHPSGVILSSRDLGDRVPMQESFAGFTMLQADKHDVEDLGLVKLDVLGVRMFSAIAHATGEIERLTGSRIDLDSVPRDDAATFELIRSSRTIGCFQIESPGQRELLARMQPERFEDLIVDISLFRPGPVQSDMVGPYLMRRHGFEDVVYPHDSLREILRETNGIIVFHEQLIRVIAAATGCDLADADYIRRHLDSNRPSLPDSPNPDDIVGRWFRASAVANGLTPPQAEALWKEVFAFASFGFCKAHAAAFAVPTYLSSWLKAHHPAEFVAGLLTHDPGMYPRRLIVADARTSGMTILPVDVNRSDAVYRVEAIEADENSDSPRRNRRTKLGVRLALSEVKDISEVEKVSIVAAQPFTSLEDLWRRTELSRPVLEHLVHLGACDGISGHRSRRELLWRAADLAARTRHKAGQQMALSLDGDAGLSDTSGLEGLPDYTAMEETEAELEVTGIDARRHIMALYEPLMKELGCTPAAELRHRRNNSEVWVAGVKVASQTPLIRSGQRIIFVTIDDPTGPMDVTLFERVRPWCAAAVFHSWILLFRGIVRKRGGASLTRRTDEAAGIPDSVGITVVVEEAFDLAAIARDRETGVSIEDAVRRQRKKAAGAMVGPAAERERPGAERERPGATTVPPRKLWHASGGSAGG